MTKRIIKVELAYFTDNPKLDENWAIGVLEEAAERRGLLEFHLQMSCDAEDDGCPDCEDRLQTRMEAK